MGEGVAIRCRTCDQPAAHVDLVRDRLVAICACCTDRTQLRCPMCRVPLTAEAPATAFCCDRPWLVRGDRLFDATGPVPEAVPASIVEPELASAPTSKPRRAASKGRLATHVVTTAQVAGYRDALYSQVLELERRAFHKPPPPAKATPLSRVRMVLAGAAALAVALTFLLGGAAGALGVVCVIAPVALLAYSAWLLFQGTPERMIRVPAQALRITPERIEAGAENVWHTIAKPAELARVVREPSEDGVRIRVELDSGRSLTLLDHLGEEEAVLAEQQIEAQLARVRG